jgi:hypothetical protein
MILNKILLITLFKLNLIIVVFADDIRTISPCIGELKDGKRIDLTSLANQKTFK